MGDEYRTRRALDIMWGGKDWREQHRVQQEQKLAYTQTNDLATRLFRKQSLVVWCQLSRISYTAFQEAKPSGLMLVPEKFVDEVADVILNDVEESDARDSNINCKCSVPTLTKARDKQQMPIYI